MVAVGVAYVAHGLLTTVDPDYTVAVVTAEALPDEAVQRLQNALAGYAEDANGDGAVIVQVNNYTWSANAALTDMNGQMAGATQMNTDLANGESKIWILDDPDGFEQAYGALSEKLGADWQTKLIPWSSQPPFPAWNWAATTPPPMAARPWMSSAALPGTAWRCSISQMSCGRRSIRKQKRPSVLFLFMWYSIHRKIDGAYRHESPYHAESCQDCSVRSGNCTEEYFARCRGLSPSQLNKITTLQVLIVRLLQMQQHKTDISSIKKSSRLQFEQNSKTSYALPS